MKTGRSSLDTEGWLVIGCLSSRVKISREKAKKRRQRRKENSVPEEDKTSQEHKEKMHRAQKEVRRSVVNHSDPILYTWFQMLIAE